MAQSVKFDHNEKIHKKSTGTAASFHEIEIGSERSFGMVFAAVFTIIGIWPVFTNDASVRWWAILIGGVFLAVALIRPSQLKPLNRAWFKLGLLLGRVVSPIVMLLVFFLTVTPTAIIMRLLGKDMLRLKKSRDKGCSFWIDRTDESQKMGSMKNQF